MVTLILTKGVKMIIIRQPIFYFFSNDDLDLDTTRSPNAITTEVFTEALSKL
jgi:hypothetical protein